MEIHKRMMHHGRRAVRRVVVFTDRYPLLGPIFWILSVQYLINTLIVATAWPQAYNWKINLISDLGSTVCGPYEQRYVCSPLHDLMNLSFIVFGATILFGSVLIYTEFKRTRLSLLGFLLMAVAGVGAIGVGLFTENDAHMAHVVSSILGLGVASVSVIVLSFGLKDVAMPFRVFSFASGGISLTAFILYAVGIYLWVGGGGMERISSFSFTIWMIAFGMYMSAVRIRARRARRA